MQTFCVRISFDEFIKLCLPARRCRDVDDTPDDDRTFTSDHVDLLGGQLVQVCKVDLGNKLLNQYQPAVVAELCTQNLTSGPDFAISAVRVASSTRRSFQDAVRRSWDVSETILCFKSRKREGHPLAYDKSDMVSLSDQFSEGRVRGTHLATRSYTLPVGHFQITGTRLFKPSQFHQEIRRSPLGMEREGAKHPFMHDKM